MTPEQFQQYLLGLPEEERLQVIDNMWAHVDGQLPGYEQLQPLLAAVNPNVMMDPNPVSGPEEFNRAVTTVFSPLPNALNQVNRIGSPDEDYSYDTTLTYRDVLQNAGYDDTAASLLGILAELVEPGPGEFAHMAAGIAGAGTALSKLAHALSADETLFRVQDVLTGRGPYMDIPSTTVARGNRTGQAAVYHTSDPEYVKNAILDSSHRDMSRFEVVASTPKPGSTVLNTAEPNVEMMSQLLDVIRNQTGLPQNQQAYLVRNFEQAIASGDPLDQSEALRDLALIGGFDRLGAPHEVGIDRFIQFPDDNYAVNRLLWDTQPTENVVFRPESLNPLTSMTTEEFMLRQAEGTLPRAASRFSSLGADAVDRYANAVASMDPSKRGFLTPHTADDLRRMVGEGYQVRMDDRGVGYILSPEGDLQGVINASGIRGAGEDAIWDAIANGAKTLDAFDGHLPDYYRRFGFEETGRAAFDPQYAPADWDYARYGTPDVVFMRYPGR